MELKLGDFGNAS
jgi:polo-like kinase 1